MSLAVCDAQGLLFYFKTGIRGHNNDQGAFNKSEIKNLLGKDEKLLGDGVFSGCHFIVPFGKKTKNFNVKKKGYLISFILNPEEFQKRGILKYEESLKFKHYKDFCEKNNIDFEGKNRTEIKDIVLDFLKDVKKMNGSIEKIFKTVIIYDLLEIKNIKNILKNENVKSNQVKKKNNNNINSVENNVKNQNINIKQQSSTIERLKYNEKNENFMLYVLNNDSNNFIFDNKDMKITEYLVLKKIINKNNKIVSVSNKTCPECKNFGLFEHKIHFISVPKFILISVQNRLYKDLLINININIEKNIYNFMLVGLVLFKNSHFITITYDNLNKTIMSDGLQNKYGLNGETYQGISLNDLTTDYQNYQVIHLIYSKII
ncbi:hypothetical protein M0812_07116 [Anaeramoeba flamelloides]|uniref:DDE Tnp4 domain-containing protein n=1 Tax=Anaeramoeba flamelloides TaxID=1746091 RepID=A0AAV8ADP1_9EUKA|nr:hypothetical protein M0812_07116 [Anaeramoeba flamelloides]